MMHAFTVATSRELRAAIKEAASLLDKKSDEELWFRGVGNRSYRLLPSLYRCKDKKLSSEELRSLESDLFFEFLAKARTQEAALDHWDVLFLMQHHRAPTRLLDWTEAAGVALYFATAGPPQERPSPRLYVMNPYAWNEEHDFGRDLFWPRYFGYRKDEDYFFEFGEFLVEDRIDWEFPAALYPPQRNVRLAAQRGYFTIHGYNSKPLDKISPISIVAIDLTAGAVAEVIEDLEHSGINEYSLFPDLDGLARYLKTKNRIS